MLHTFPKRQSHNQIALYSASFEFPDNFGDIVENKEQIKLFLERFIKEKSNDISPLINAFEQMFDYDKFIQSDINFACMTYNVSKMKPQPFFKKDITRENAVSVIIGSASCFPAFPMMEINGEKYIDGGYADNVPVSLVKEMEADEIYAVDVHGPGHYGSINHEEVSLYIEPILPLSNFLDFRSEQGIRSLRLGYLETRKYLDQCCGYIYTFDQNCWPDISQFEKYAQLFFEEFGLILEDTFYYKAICSVLGYKPKQLLNKFNSKYHYGMLLEALALCSGTNAINLYDWKQFVKIVYEALQTLTPIDKPSGIKEAFLILKNAHKEDIVVFFYELLKENDYKLPKLYEPFRVIFDVSYSLACMWCLLDRFVKMV